MQFDAGFDDLVGRADTAISGLFPDALTALERADTIALTMLQTLDVFLGAVYDWWDLYPRLQAAIDARTSLAPFVEETKDLLARFTTISETLDSFGVSSMLEFHQLALDELEQVYDVTVELALPFSDQLNTIFASAGSGNSLTRAQLGPGEGFTVSGEEEASTTLRFFDPATGFYGEDRVTFGSSRSGSTILNQRPTLDSDGDGIPDVGELVIGTNPQAADSDGDGILDGAELRGGNPLAAASLPTGILGAIALEGTAAEVVVAGDAANPAGRTAYVLSQEGTLSVVNVAEPTLPILQGQVMPPGGARAIAAAPRGDVVYLAAGNAGVHIVDVSDPLVPRVQQTVKLFDDALSVAVVGSLVVAGGTGRLSVIDPATGTVLHSTPVAGPVNDMAVHEDGTLYAVIRALQPDGSVNPVAPLTVQAFDVDRDGVLTLGGVVLDPLRSREVNKITISGDVAYVSIGNEFLDIAPTRPQERGGYVTVDVGDPGRPALISTLDVGNVAAGNFETVDVGGGLGLTASGTLGLGLVDTADPDETFVPIGQFDTPGEALGVTFAGGYAYIADGTAGLQIVNVRDADRAGVAPTVSIDPSGLDTDPGRPGIQVVEGQAITLPVSANDDIGVASVALLADGVREALDETGPFSLTYLPLLDGADAREVTLTALALDTGGNTKLSAPVSVEIVPDDRPFAVERVTPSEGSVLLGDAQTVEILFSRPVDRRTLDAASLTLVPDDGSAAVSALTARVVEAALGRATGVFSIPDLPVGAYTLRFDGTAVRDTEGNALAATEVTRAVSVGDFSLGWIGTVSADWSDPDNWSTGALPGADDLVGMPLAPGEQVILDSTVGAVGGLLVSGAGTLNLAGNSVFIELGTLANQGNVQLIENGVPVGRPTVDAIVNDGQLTLAGNAQLNTVDTVVNSGTIRIIGQSRLFIDGTAPSLTGGGTIALSDLRPATSGSGIVGPNVSITFGERPLTLVNVDNTITGTGNFGVGYNFQNAPGGLVEARGNDVLSLTASFAENDGVLRAMDGGLLVLNGRGFAGSGTFGFRSATFLDNADGVIEAAGGVIDLFDATISGGVLRTIDTAAGPGVIAIGQTGGNGFATLDGTTDPIEADARLIVDGFLNVAGNIRNAGDTQIRYSEFTTEIQVTEFTTLSGGGTLTLLGTGTGSFDDPDVNIITVFEQEFDDFGDPVFDEFGDPIIFGANLSIDDHTLQGSGTIGDADDEEYEDGFIPLFEVAVAADGVISANASQGTLRFVNTSLTNSGLVATEGGDLLMQNTDFFNLGTTLVDGGTLRMTRPGFSNGGFFFNSADGLVQVNAGLLEVSVSFFNDGEVFVAGGTARFNSSVTERNGFFSVGDGELVFATSSDAFVDLAPGDGSLVLEDTGSFSGFVAGFAPGDTIVFRDLTAEDARSVSFEADSGLGTLFIEAAEGTFTLDFIAEQEDLDSLTPDDFILSNDERGSLVLQIGSDTV